MTENAASKTVLNQPFGFKSHYSKFLHFTKFRTLAQENIRLFQLRRTDCFICSFLIRLLLFQDYSSGAPNEDRPQYNNELICQKGVLIIALR